MTINTHRSDIELPSAKELVEYTREVERQAQLARSLAAHALFTALWRRVRAGFARWGDLVSFAQRMNQQARL